ncbi:MAG: efflux RND transporter permease subunit [Pseudomonadota bacterium]
MKRLIRAALGNRVLPNLLMVLILAAGVVSLNTLTVKVFPEISTGTISVSVALPGSSPGEVRDSIVEPIENALEGLPGIREVTATARSDMGTVLAELTRGARIDAVLRDIEAEVEAITIFPDAAEAPQIIEVEPDERAAQLLLTGPVGVDALKSLAERVRRDLLAMDTISQVNIVGAPGDQIVIEVSQDTLKRVRLSLPQFADAVAAQSIDLAAGELENAADRIRINTEGQRETAEDFRQTVMFASEAGATVALGDLAMVTDGFSQNNLISLYGNQPALFLNINRVGDQQILGIVDAVQGYLDDTLRPDLPDGVQAIVWRNEASALQGRIDLLVKNGAIGITLILIVLALFLDVRIAAWVAAGVVVSFVGTFALMSFFGITINQLSLFGFILALGIVVDDAIVVGEAVYSEQKRQEDPAKAAQTAAARMAAPVFFSVTTTIAAFVPLLFLPGASGSFIFPVAAIVIMVLTLSLIESFFVLPQHLSHIHPGKAPRAWSPRRLTDPARRLVGGNVDRFADTGLRDAIKFSVRHPMIIIATAIAVLVGSLGLLMGGHVKFVFFPSIEGNFVTAEIELAESVSEQVTLERAQVLRDAIPGVAEQLGDEHGIDEGTLIQGVTTTIGFAAGTDGQGAANVARVTLKLVDAAERPFGASAVQAAWRAAVGPVPGARSVEFSSSLVGIGSAIVLEVSADSEDARDRAVERLRRALEDREGVIGIRDSRFTAAREIDVALRPDAQVYGISTVDLARQVRAAFFGAQVTTLQREREEVDVRVRLPEDERNSVADLQRLPIRVGDAFVPLAAVATLTFDQSPSVIDRVGGRTIATLTADVDTAVTTGGQETGWIMETVVPDLKQDIAGLRVGVGGEQQEQGRTTPALARNFTLAMIVVYAILALAFQSFTRPILVLGIVPFGIVGALLGHYALNLNLTLLSVFGIIGLSGILINGGLLINDFVLEKERDGADPFDAIVDSTVARFRPILLTTLTTFLGIFPLILETSVQARFLIPTAVSLAFGVLVGVFILIFLMPAYCALYARAQAQIARWRGAHRQVA